MGLWKYTSQAFLEQEETAGNQCSCVNGGALSQPSQCDPRQMISSSKTLSPSEELTMLYVLRGPLHMPYKDCNLLKTTLPGSCSYHSAQ